MVETLIPTGLLPENFKTVGSQLHENCKKESRNAFVCLDDGQAVTWQDLFNFILKVAHFLKINDIKANDRIVVLGENTIENLIFYYGIQAYGATYCTINVEINRNHLLEMLHRLQPKFVLFQEGLGLDTIDDSQVGKWVSYGSRLSDNGLFEALHKFSQKPKLDPVNELEDRCVISFTSGTSAQPKGVLHSFSNYQAIAQHQIERWTLTGEDRILEFRSFSWASSHMLSLNPVLLAGATLLFAKRFSRSKFQIWIKTYKPTIIIAVPTVVNMLLDEPIKNAKNVFSGVRFVSCSTAPLMPDSHQRFEDTYCVPLVQLYGMSEGGVVAANRPETRVIGSVGTAGLYQKLKIKGPGNSELPRGEIGEIESISAQHAHAYLYADAKMEAIRGEPLKTGDLGYMDEDGFLHITGRAKDVIIKGGVNISPLEIDAILTTHKDIAEAVTFGIPDPIYGENLACFVTLALNANITNEDIVAHCRTKLTEIKCPKEIMIINKIPKNDRGKIDRITALEVWRTKNFS